MSELKVTKTGDFSLKTAQTSGMERFVAISEEANGSGSLWAGFATMGPSAKSGAHHHGDAESAIYVISGRGRFRWGERLEQTTEAGAGDFVFIPANLVHQEINALDDEPLKAIVVRSLPRDMVINVDIPEA